MPCPPCDPEYYSESTIWWSCSICSKMCKSKSGRIRHIMAVHGTMQANSSTLPDAAFNNLTEIPLPPSENSLSLQFQQIVTPDPIDNLHNIHWQFEETAMSGPIDELMDDAFILSPAYSKYSEELLHTAVIQIYFRCFRFAIVACIVEFCHARVCVQFASIDKHWYGTLSSKYEW